MARYAVTYTCGHEGNVYLTGNSRFRENRLASIESGLCFECYKQQSTDHAKTQAEEQDLPQLTGTEKQIAWAEVLRIQKLDEIERYLEDITEEDKGYRSIILAVERICRETLASKWIEWRNDIPEWIIREVFASLKSEPTEEQRRKEREEQAGIAEIKRQALIEASIRPGKTVSEMAAEIHVNDRTIAVSFPEQHNDFIETVKSRGYIWSGKEWQRTINAFAGQVEDRAIELGVTLLAQGFVIRVFDEPLRTKIVEGNFEPEQTRWITKMVKGPYAGWFVIRWSKNEDYYAVARRVKNSKYVSPYVVVPPENFDQVLDFAERYDFKLSEGAQGVACIAKEDKEQTLVVASKPVPQRDAKTSALTTPPVLEVPELVAVDAELRDN